jgi:hypothetical protein
LAELVHDNAWRHRAEEWRMRHATGESLYGGEIDIRHDRLAFIFA